MKNLYLLAFTFLAINISCNNDDLLDTYNTGNKSEKFFGKWTSVGNRTEEFIL